jgi:hypothetical protein
MEGVIEVNPEQVDALYASGVELPYVHFGQVEPALKLMYGGEDYWYVRTLPLKGYGAVMAGHIRGLEADGKRPILARFWDRIYIYATGVTPIGTGKK